MNGKQLIPVKVGKSGTKVHLGYTINDGFGKTDYRHICSVVNSHHINRHPRVKPLRVGTQVNCEKCIAVMAKRATVLSDDEIEAELADLVEGREDEAFWARGQW